MASLTIIAVGGVTVTNLAGAAPRNGNPLMTSLWGDGFSWEVPDDLRFTFDFGNTVTLDFADVNGILSDDPYSGDVVADQRLTAPVTIGGQSWSPTGSTIRWQSPAPVVVEHEYSVVLYDALGNSYQMVGVSITTGYSTQVVGIAFLNEAPPPGTPLYYHQGVSTYVGSGSAPIPDLTVDPSTAPCFLRGTRIATPFGPQTVEELAAGDLVLTQDNGPMPLLWAGSSVVAGTGRLAPVRISAGHLGNDRDLMLSQTHRVMVAGAMAELLFGEPEVLVAARHLVDGRWVRLEPQREVEYFHLLLEDHQILLAEGAPVESLYLGQQVLEALDDNARSEIAAIFPQQPWQQALIRPTLGAREGRLLRAG